MAERKKSGRLGAFITVLVILVSSAILLRGVFALFYTSKGHSMERTEEKAQARAAAVTTLVFKEDDLPRFPFPKVASQASVSWKLRTSGIQERDGKIVGDFNLPWKIHHLSSHRNSVQVRASPLFLHRRKPSSPPRSPTRRLGPRQRQPLLRRQHPHHQGRPPPKRSPARREGVTLLST